MNQEIESILKPFKNKEEHKRIYEQVQVMLNKVKQLNK